MILSELLEEIKSGKFNLIIIGICLIFFFHIYNHIITCQKRIENMADVSDAQLAEAVKKYYLSDDFIKGITAAAAQVQKDGLTISGDLNVTGKFNYLPKGTIVMWNGTAAPTGWALCDGTNGTPNLRDRFVLGYGSRFINTIGGEENVTLNLNQIPSHSHSGSTSTDGNHQHGGSTSTNGNHNHFTNVYKGYGGDCRNCSHNFQPLGGSDGGIGTNDAGNHSHSISTDWQGNHSHSFSTNAQGGNGSHNNMPPFYVLAFIIKL